MSLRIKDATPIEELQDQLLFAVGNTEGDTDGCISLGQTKDFIDADKAQVAFTGSYLNLSDTPNLEAYVLMTTLNTNYYNKNQINQLIGGLTGIKFKVVDTLPEVGETNIIYLILHQNTQGGDLIWHEDIDDPLSGGDDEDIYDEYVWLPDGRTFEKIGSTSINLSDYYTKSEVDLLIPVVNNYTITLQQGGVTKGSFTLNQSTAATINFDESFVQEQADWNESDPSAVEYIKNKPTIPEVNDPAITFTQGGTIKGNVTLNQSTAATIEFEKPYQSDWTVEDPNEPSFINNKPDTMSLLLTYDDDSTDLVDFYIAGTSHQYSYMYIQNTYNGNNTITLTTTKQGSPGYHATRVEYSRNMVDWTSLNLVEGGTNTITMSKGERVYFRQGDYSSWNYKDGSYPTNYWITTFTASERHNAGGDLGSLVGSYQSTTGSGSTFGRFVDLFKGDTKLVDASNIKGFGTAVTSLYMYAGMFDGCTSLVGAPDLVVSGAISGNQAIFDSMFKNCSSLVNPPVLDTGGNTYNSCFRSMFEGCTSLVTTPELPAKYMTQSCYYNMFKDCSSLVTAPELTSKNLDLQCYLGMFEGCSSLRNVPELPAKTLSYGCYQNMFKNCSSLVIPPAIYGLTLADNCCTGMFYGCTSLIATPALRAKTLTQNSYKSMFSGCSSLDNVTIFADDISASNCLNGWLTGVAQSGEFHNNGSAVYTTSSTSGIPSGWTDVQPDDDYLYIKNTYNGTNTITTDTVKTTIGGEPPVGSYATSIEYSTDKTNWSTLSFDLNTHPTITVAAGQTLYFRNDTGVFNTAVLNRYSYRTSFVISQECIVGGNPSSLLDYNNTSTVSIPDGAFSRLFTGSDGVVDGSRLTMTSSPINFCLSYAFRDCRNLVAGPVFNTSVAKSCFEGFFQGCTSLKTSSELPATTLADGCYNTMYYGCSNLVNAPELPAATLAIQSYFIMFRDCTSLSELVVYADDISAYICTERWLENVAPAGTLHNLGSATYTVDSVNGIPTGWTETNS